MLRCCIVSVCPTHPHTPAYGALFTKPYPNTTCEAVKCVKTIKADLSQREEEELAKEQATAEANSKGGKEVRGRVRCLVCVSVCVLCVCVWVLWL